jgi:hypothetical protein
MQISKAYLIAFLAGTAALQLQSQTASPEAQARALELLRQSTSPAQPGSIPPSVVYPSKPASPDQQQQAVQLLRQTIALEQASAPQKPSKVSSTKTTQSPSSPAPSPTSSIGVVQGTVAVPAAPGQVAGPNTKQQRLMDLLELYKADKISPAEYQARRAKILAEP